MTQWRRGNIEEIKHVYNMKKALVACYLRFLVLGREIVFENHDRNALVNGHFRLAKKNPRKNKNNGQPSGHLNAG